MLWGKFKNRHALGWIQINFLKNLLLWGFGLGAMKCSQGFLWRSQTRTGVNSQSIIIERHIQIIRALDNVKPLLKRRIGGSKNIHLSGKKKRQSATPNTLISMPVWFQAYRIATLFSFFCLSFWVQKGPTKAEYGMYEKWRIRGLTG